MNFTKEQIESMRREYEVTSEGRVLGTVKAKDLHCAAKQARKKYWPTGQSRFTFQVCIKRDVAMSSIAGTERQPPGEAVACNQTSQTTNDTIMPTQTLPDWQGKHQPVPKVKGSICDDREDLSVTLVQQSLNRFAVIYGLQVKKNMPYAEAAAEYGQCIFHALACAGTLRTPPNQT